MYWLLRDKLFEKKYNWVIILRERERKLLRAYLKLLHRYQTLWLFLKYAYNGFFGISFFSLSKKYFYSVLYKEKTISKW